MKPAAASPAAAAYASDLCAQAIEAVRGVLYLPPIIGHEGIAKRYCPMVAGWIHAALQFDANAAARAPAAADAKPAARTRTKPPAALKEIEFESLVVAAAASAMLAGEPLAESDRERLALASERIQAALRKAGL